MQNESLYKQTLLRSNYLSASQLSSAVQDYCRQKEQGYGASFSRFLLEKGIISAEQHRNIMLQCADMAETRGQKPRRFGCYEIISQIAAGGMGIVYQARHIETQNLFAIKMLHGIVPGEEELKRFHREAEAASLVNHANVVRVHEFGHEEGVYFLAMDLVVGKPLSEYRPSKINECVDICRQICQGLQCIHNRGIVHRDIKPANILIDLSGTPTPKITDFSLALMQDPLKSRITRSGTALGTPYYMAPEQAMGQKNIDLRADIYSLGVVLYELITGKLPYQAANISELYAKIMTEHPLPPSSIRRTVRKEMDRIIDRAMAKDPCRRYRDAGEMAEDLAAYLARKRTGYSLKASLWQEIRRRGYWTKSNVAIGLLSCLLSITILIILALLKKQPDFTPALPLSGASEQNRAYLLYQKLAKTDPQSPDFWHFLCEIEQLPPSAFPKTGDVAYQQLPEVFRTICSLRLDNFKEAWEILETHPNSPLLCYVRGKARIYLGDWRRARNDLRYIASRIGAPASAQDHCLYYLGLSDYATIHSRLRDLPSPAKMRDHLLYQGLAKMMLAEIKTGPKYSKKALEELEAIFEALVAQNVPGAYLYLSIVQSCGQKDEAAQANLRRALAAGVPEICIVCRQPRDTAGLEDLARLRELLPRTPDFTYAYLLAGNLCQRGKQYEEGSGYYQKALALEPMCVQAHLGMGIALMFMKQPQAALAEYDKAFAVYCQGNSYSHDPFTGEMFYAAMSFLYKGVYWEGVGKNAEALRNYRIASYLSGQTMADLLRCYQNQQRYFNALQEAFALYPNDVLAGKAIGDISLDELKNKAHEQLRRQLTEAPDAEKARLYAQYGFVLLLMKKLQEARQFLDRSLQTSPTAEGYFLRGEYWACLKQYGSAWDDYQQSLALDPDNYLARYGKLRCHGNVVKEKTQEHLRSLIEEMTAILEQQPDYQHLDAFFHHANNALSGFLGVEDNQVAGEAMSYFEHLLSLNKSNSHHNRSWACSILANHYSRIEKDDRAMRLHDQSVQWSPNYWESYRYRARFFKKIGKTDLAVADYRMALFLLEDIPLSVYYSQIAQELAELEN